MPDDAPDALDEDLLLESMIPVIGTIQSDIDESAILDALRIRAARLLYGRPR